MQLKPHIMQAINVKAHAHGIRPELVAAFVVVESSGRPWATRFEVDFGVLRDEHGKPRRDEHGHLVHSPALVAQAERFARATGTSYDTELTHEKTSWGLMQIMGSTARELGFRGHMPELGQVELGLELGCSYLAKQAVRFASLAPGELLGWHEQVVAAYNAGTPHRRADGAWQNADYVRRVAAALAEQSRLV